VELEGFDLAAWREQAVLWYLLDFIVDKVCFLRRDAQFEAPAAVSQSTLFPSDGVLLRATERLLS